MQVERIQVLVQQATAGNAEAFIALVQEFAPALRLVLAAHLDQPAAVITVEVAVWSAVRTRLGEWSPDTPFADWLMQVAVGPVGNHLAVADRRAIDLQDALSHQIIGQCREALNDGAELPVTGLPGRLAALPEATRTLLVRRYRERQRPSALAASLMISEAELATSLSAARAACDWRGLAKPPGPGDRLLPPLIEDWLGGTIDVDSRALLATNLGRDPERAQQFARQVRVHVVLGAVLAPFSREDAVALARQSGLGAGDSGRVVMGESPRVASGVRGPGSDAARAVRPSISNRQHVPVADSDTRSSPLPWILGGGMVLVGVIALVLMSTSGPARHPRKEPQHAGEHAPTTPSTTPTADPGTTPRNQPGTGGVLRLDPGRAASERTAAPPVVALNVPSVAGRVLAQVPLELKASLSHVIGVKSVEFWLGDQRLEAIDIAPYTCTWTPTAAGQVTVSLRVMGADGVLANATPVTVEVLPTLGTGSITREWWTGIPGGLVADGQRVAGYPERPNGTASESSFASPIDWGDHYLQRMRGLLIPPLDGEYVFWIAGDDESQLWLSDDHTRARLRRIALAPFDIDKGIAPGEWERVPEQRSVAIYLRRGERYYIEVLHKENDGGDHVEVGWRLPGGVLERPIPGRHLSPVNDLVTSAQVIAAAPSPSPIPSPTPAPAPAPVVQAITAGEQPFMVLWDGTTRAGGSGYASSGIAKVAGSGRDGGPGLQATMATDFVNLGWNWHGWFPDDSGDDVRGGNALGFWLRVDGANRPTNASIQFLSGPQKAGGRSASIDIHALVPAFADGQWHQVVVPFERLAGQGLDLARLWEFNLKLQGRGVLAGTVQIDDLMVLRTGIAQPTPTPAPVPVPAGKSLVRSIDFVSSGAAYIEAEARNGEKVYIDREYKLVDLPPAFSGGRLIRTRNDDDGATANPHLRFTTDVPVDVYVAYSVSARQLPAWMQGWTATTVLVGADAGGGFRLHRRTFPAGAITLGANERGTTHANSNYFVFVLPAARAPVWRVVRAINLGGETVEVDGVRFLGHRQAEAEGATPAGSHQPGPRLSDLPWVRANNANGDVRRNRSWSDKPLSIAGQQYTNGLGLHAGAEVVFDLAGRYSGFTAVVGIDDAATPGEAIFQVWADGQKLFDSGVLRHGTAKPVAVPLAGRKELRLVVDPNGGNDWDHSDWGNAQLLLPGGNDGVLQVQAGRRATATFAPKPAADAKLRSVLSTSLAGTKEGLSFRVKVADGPARVWIYLGENGPANSRQFDLMIEDQTLPAVGSLASGGWEKLGPIEVVVTGGLLDVGATALKGTPQILGMVVEQPGE